MPTKNKSRTCSPKKQASPAVSKTRFAMIPYWLLDSDVSAVAIRVYGTLALVTRNSCYSFDAIADRTHLSRRDVKRAFRGLEEFGALRFTVDSDGELLGFTLHTTHPCPSQ